MECYEDFKVRNAGFDGGFVSEKSMERNYEIALCVENSYNVKYGKIDGPRIGDIVEFSDGFQIYKNAKIVENLYGDSNKGMLCVCENGSSHTDGKFFSTSGGAFKSFHKSCFKLIGEEVNIVWTWGCNGAGANQGIYFPLKVRKWLIPYERTEIIASIVEINGSEEEIEDRSKPIPLTITNSGDGFYSVMHFVSVSAFVMWADYVGYKYKRWKGNWGGSVRYKSSQKIIKSCILNREKKPKNGVPMKSILNGRAVDSWAVDDGENIHIYMLNESRLSPKFGSKEYEEEVALFRKYEGNPLGI